MSRLDGQIIRVSKDEEARNYKFYPEAARLKNVQVISIDDLDEYRKEGYIIPMNVVEGSVLALHPFHPQKYIDINEAENEIIREKINYIGDIAQLLGARTVNGHVVSMDVKEVVWDASGGVKYKGVGAGFSGLSKKKEAEQYDYKLERMFSGERSLEGYNQAKKKMEEYGMDKDVEIKTLVEMCNPIRNNLIKVHKVHVDISREVNSSKEFAFTLSALEIFKLDATVKNCVSELKTLKFECLIEF